MCDAALSCRFFGVAPLLSPDPMLSLIGLDSLHQRRHNWLTVHQHVTGRRANQYVLNGAAVVPTVCHQYVYFVFLLRCHSEFLSSIVCRLIISLYTKTNRMSSSNFVLSLMRALPAARQRARDGGTHNPSKSFGARLLVTSRQTAAVEAGVTGYAARRCEWGRRAARVEGRGRG